MTAIAVQKLARADSVSIGFIGCGVQARSLFDVLRLVLPDLKEVVACGRSAASAERFVAMVRGAGLVARTTLEPREAIEGLDVIITTVPEGAQVLEFLDTAWVTPGAFVGAVDLARSWKRGALRAMAQARESAFAEPCLVFVDSLPWALRRAPHARLPPTAVRVPHSNRHLSVTRRVYSFALAKGRGARG